MKILIGRVENDQLYLAVSNGKIGKCTFDNLRETLESLGVKLDLNGKPPRVISEYYAHHSMKTFFDVEVADNTFEFNITDREMSVNPDALQNFVEKLYNGCYKM